MSDPGDLNNSRSADLLADLRAALDAVDRGWESDFARLDFQRSERTGTPEIILAEHKSSEQVMELATRMVERNGSVLLSRVPDATLDEIQRRFEGYQVDHPPGSSMVRVEARNSASSSRSGNVAIFTAGTSDLPRAHEVQMVVEEMGATARVWADMGVAGLHRLIQPFREAIDWNASAIVVAAGMDGALPSVIAGLSPVPVIGLPVSIGYGFGGSGEGALMAMLQTCAPGLTVVNIDNSVGAGIAAARIARQSASKSE